MPGTDGDRGALGTVSDDLNLSEQDKIFNESFVEALTGNAGTSGVDHVGDEPIVNDSNITTDLSTDTGSSAPVVTDDTHGTAGPAAVVPTPIPDDTDKQRYLTLQGIFKKDKETWDTKEAAYKKQVEEYEKAEATRKQSAAIVDPTKILDPLAGLSAADKKELEEYDKEFDTVSKYESIKRKADLAAFGTAIRSELAEALKNIVDSFAPVISTTQENAKEKHFSAVSAAHKDYETYYNDGSIDAWIATKPRYLQEAFTKVRDEGTAAEVIDLLNTFKKENNIGPASAENTGAGGAPNIPEKSAAEIEAERKKAEKLAALTGVRNRRGGINANSSDTGDFDSSFDEASAKLK